jgi:hypothetical protein
MKICKTFFLISLLISSDLSVGKPKFQHNYTFMYPNIQLTELVHESFRDAVANTYTITYSTTAFKIQGTPVIISSFNIALNSTTGK